jgi:hypothetical protein
MKLGSCGSGSSSAVCSSRSSSDVGNGGFILLLTRVDSNLNSDGPAANIFAFESCDRLLLLFLTSNIDEAVTLALPRATEAPADNASGVNGDTGIGEEGGKTCVVDVEAEIGDEEHCLGGFTSGVLAFRTRGTRGPRLAYTRLLGLGRSGSISISGCSRGGSSISSFSTFGGLCLGLALEERGDELWCPC